MHLDILSLMIIQLKTLFLFSGNNLSERETYVSQLHESQGVTDGLLYTRRVLSIWTGEAANYCKSMLPKKFLSKSLLWSRHSDMINRKPLCGVEFVFYVLAPTPICHEQMPPGLLKNATVHVDGINLVIM